MQKKYISDKIQHLLMIKTLRKVKNRRQLLYLLLIKKIKAMIIINSKKLDAFILRESRRQGYQLSPPLFNIRLKVLGSAVKHKKINKRHTALKGRHRGLWIKMAKSEDIELTSSHNHNQNTFTCRKILSGN